MAASDDIPASTNPADRHQQQPTSSSMSYPHLELLSRLQSISSTRNNNEADDNDEIKDPAADHNTTKDNPQQQQQSNNEWNLSTDALLATILHELSTHIQSRTHHVSSEIRTLQKSVNQVGVEVGLVQQQWMKKSLDICMEQVVGEDDESDDDSESGEEGGDDVVRNKISAQQQQQQEDDDDDDDSSADIARLEAEEKAAIQNGMKALSLFFDPKRKSKKKSNDDDDDISDESDHHDNMVISTEEDNMIGDNCYFYPAADADVFNQRPLPLIVGSREFMESCCGVEGGGSIEN
ncbi:hypothetical protein QTG54_006508 [Skeletonema marinoi]|uniref:Uncharacterized protein n=1 Tax=Skeletonema marinoi TaxID=267567 RepID=A0AAD8YAK9_9STRA|nr:hypothetical protein QTG54_006508 [Skeletonema marinoi]